MTKGQALYHARRAYAAEYHRKMGDPMSQGRSSDRIDSAQWSAELAFDHRLREHGFDRNSWDEQDEVLEVLSELAHSVQH